MISFLLSHCPSGLIVNFEQVNACWYSNDIFLFVNKTFTIISCFIVAKSFVISPLLLTRAEALHQGVIFHLSKIPRGWWISLSFSWEWIRSPSLDLTSMHLKSHKIGMILLCLSGFWWAVLFVKDFWLVLVPSVFIIILWKSEIRLIKLSSVKLY